MHHKGDEIHAIYEITPYTIETIITEGENNYYWSDNWSDSFYIALAKAGFISTSYETPQGLVLLPELQYEYAVLDFCNLHISKKVKKLLQRHDYRFEINTHFDEIVESFDKYHKYNWIQGRYKSLLHTLFYGRYENFKLISIALISQENDSIIAAEVGYIIGKTYTSLSGFSSREKRYANYGTLQLVLLANYLKKEGFTFWNLGHPYMEYKKRLGATIVSRKLFLQRWYKETNV